MNGSNATGIWLEGNGSLDLVVRAGDSAPGTSEKFSNSFGSPVLNNAGHIAFWGHVTGPRVFSGNDLGLWSEVRGSLSLIAREGDSAADTSGNYAILVSGSPRLNDTGQTAFRGQFTDTDTRRGGMWTAVGGSPKLVAATGDVAPGVDGTFSSFISVPVLNGSGKIAFHAALTGSGVDFDSDRGIWSGSGESLVLVVREGDVAPGTSFNFRSFSGPNLNSAGHIAFRGRLSGVSSRIDDGIWSERGESLALIVREGDEAPGTSAKFSSFGTMVLNGADQLAFLGHLFGPGVNSSDDNGIWAEDLSGRLTLIAREGDLLDVDNGPGVDFRTIRVLDFTGNFNDRGQLAFHATFTDGSSGIFVSNLVAIPEPSSLLLAGLAGAGIFVGRRRLAPAKLGRG